MTDVRRVALSYKFVLYCIGFFVFSITWGVVSPAFTKATDVAANQSSHQNATTGIDYVTTGWEWLPLFVALLLVLGLVAAAAAESRGP